MSDTAAIQDAIDQFAHDLSQQTGQSVDSLRAYAQKWGAAAIEWGIKLAQARDRGDTSDEAVMEFNLRDVVAGAKLEAAIYGIQVQARIETLLMALITKAITLI